MSDRAQSAVIGVAVLLAVTVVSVAALTVTVGSLVDRSADTAEARAAATSMNDALATDRSGPHERQFALHSGRLRTVDRTVRLLQGSEPVVEQSVGGLVYADSNYRVRAVAGATVSDTGGGGRLHTAPSISIRDRTLFVGLPRLGADAVAVGGKTTVTLRTNLTHTRQQFSGGGYALAVETRAPGVWERHFEALGATTTRRSFDDDGVASVVARFPSVRTVHVFVHDLRLEVGR
ncbi:DUF7289 family protein [Haloplanus halobius]|uniref:DUF7289 family protein n=1 Tax=Haloplanus halobius TaxID=2934938 RepID=UPI00200CFB39|nr:type IV pilin [Haloplanus sp. XH21]